MDFTRKDFKKDQTEIKQTDFKTQIEENKDGTLNIKNVEIFRVGTFNNKVYTVEDLNDAVKMYEQSKENFTPILKLTHDEPKDTQNSEFRKQFNIPFRVGNVENLKVVGTKLYADFINVIKPIGNAIKNKLIYTHSAEFYPNVEFKGNKFKKFLYGVALLGSDIPALFEVFKPYMYSLENSINQMTENITNINICDIIDMTDDQQKLCYEQDLKLILEEGENVANQAIDKPLVDSQEQPEQQKQSFDLEKFNEMSQNFENLQKQVFELTNKLLNQKQSSNDVLQQQIKELKFGFKKEEVEKFTLDLVSQAKITPAVGDKLKAVLLNAENTVKEKFSIGAEEKETTMFDMIKDIFSLLPENPAFKLEEQVKAAKVDKFNLDKNFEIGSNEEFEAFEYYLSKQNKDINSLNVSEYTQEMNNFRARKIGGQ